MSQQNEIQEIFKGLLLLIQSHLITLGLMFLTYYYLVRLNSFFAPLGSIMGIWLLKFSLWQLLYVTPICIWLIIKTKYSMLKGVIIGAIITALLNGGCYLALPLLF
ncbi:hypothetical protein [Calothrix sp. CCY 0018]|uniref:hypothetical protein n=1 Tax=Calothrix sp. CCY 0018 TaxID=3103864 RepID=UPI0039C6B01D